MDRKLCEAFAKNPRVNPLTGRRIDTGGPTYRRIAALCAKYRSGGVPPAPRPRNAGVAPSDCEKFEKDGTRNPVTGRAISKGGAVYAKLEKACGERVSPRGANAVQKKPARKIAGPPKQTCLGVGLRQLSGTCWFNAGINLLVLGGRAGAFFGDLSASARDPASVQFARGGACPRKLTKDLVLGYMRRVFHGDFSATPGGRYARNHAARMLGKLGHIEGVGEHGGNPVHGLKKILEVTLPKSSYALLYKVGDLRTAPPSARFAAILPNSDSYFSWGYAPPSMVWDFHLDSVVIAFLYKSTVRGETMGHAIVGFFCGRKPYVFDANRHEVIRIDWHGAMTSKPKLSKLWKAINAKPDGGYRYGGLFMKVQYPLYFYSK
jgi:hypothetical protein